MADEFDYREILRKPSAPSAKAADDEFDYRSRPAAAPERDTPTVSQGRAAVLGFGAGVTGNWGDEIYGYSKGSGLPEWMGGFRAPVGAAKALYERATVPVNAPKSEFRTRVDEAIAGRRAEEAKALEEHMGTYMGSQLAGALTLPSGAVAHAATAPARIARGMGVGSTYGAISGAGSGKTDEERESRANMGAIFGGAVGGAVPFASEAARAVAKTPPYLMGLLGAATGIGAGRYHAGRAMSGLAGRIPRAQAGQLGGVVGDLDPFREE